MLFCPHCRHQLSRTWAGNVCLSCGACFQGEEESSIVSLNAYTPAGFAYLALLGAIPSYRPTTRAALAVHATLEEFLGVETHFPRAIWNAQPEVRRRYTKRVTATEHESEAPRLYENVYPTTRFLEQARVYLKQLFHGETTAGQLFNPLEGDSAADYNVVYSRLDTLVAAHGYAARLPLGFCDACGLLAEIGPYSPMQRQISLACLDCRGARQPYLEILRAAGAFRKPTSPPPYKRRAAAPPRPGQSSWEQLYGKETAGLVEGTLEILAGINNGVTPSFGSNRVTLKTGLHGHGFVRLIPRNWFLLVEVQVPDEREWMDRLGRAGFEVNRRETYEERTFGFRLTVDLLRTSQALLRDLFGAAYSNDRK